MVAAQVLDRGGIVGVRRVHALAHGRKRAGVQRLEADQHARAAAARHQGEKLVVFRAVDAQLPHPPLARRLHAAAEFLEARNVHREIVVDEEDDVLVQGLDLGHDLVERTRRVAAAEELLHRAELAVERAAARGFDQVERPIATASVERTVGDRTEHAALSKIPTAQRTGAQIGKDAGPCRFRIAAHDGVGVCGGLVRVHRRMKSAEEHLRALCAKPVRDLVAPRGGIALNWHRHDVRPCGIVHLVKTVVHEQAVNPLRRQRRHHRERQRLHDPRLRIRGASALVPHRRLDEKDGHSHPRFANSVSTRQAGTSLFPYTVASTHGSQCSTFPSSENSGSASTTRCFGRTRSRRKIAAKTNARLRSGPPESAFNAMRASVPHFPARTR